MGNWKIVNYEELLDCMQTHTNLSKDKKNVVQIIWYQKLISTLIKCVKIELRIAINRCLIDFHFELSALLR